MVGQCAPVVWGNGANGFLCAAQYSQHSLLEDLCDRGVDQWWTDDDGNTALHCAAVGENEQGVARLLQEGAPTDLRNSQGLTAEMISLAQGTDAITRLFLDSSESLRHPQRRFRFGNWTQWAAGLPVYLVIVATIVMLTATGDLPLLGTLVGVALLALFGAHDWQQAKLGPIASDAGDSGGHR